MNDSPDNPSWYSCSNRRNSYGAGVIRVFDLFYVKLDPECLYRLTYVLHVLFAGCDKFE